MAIKKGDRITFDANARGVNPRITQGVVLSVSKSVNVKGQKSEPEYKVKLDNGNTVTIGNLEIESARENQTTSSRGIGSSGEAGTK